MPGAEFVDTNIWVYAHQDAPDDARSALAWAFIHRKANIVISAQVVAEYFNVMQRKDQELCLHHGRCCEYDGLNDHLIYQEPQQGICSHRRIPSENTTSRR